MKSGLQLQYVLSDGLHCIFRHLFIPKILSVSHHIHTLDNQIKGSQAILFLVLSALQVVTFLCL